MEKYNFGETVIAKVTKVQFDRALVSVDEKTSGIINFTTPFPVTQKLKVGDCVEVEVFDILRDGKLLLSLEKVPELNGLRLFQTVMGDVLDIRKFSIVLRLENGSIGVIPKGNICIDSSINVHAHFKIGDRIRSRIIKFLPNGVSILSAIKTFPSYYLVLPSEQNVEPFKADINPTTLQDSYYAIDHAIDRWILRVNPDESRTEAYHKIEQMCHTGLFLFDTTEHRYIKNGDLFLPCEKLDNHTFLVKTVMLWSMVEDNLDFVKNKYLDETAC